MASRKDFEATARTIRKADLSPRQHRDLTRAFAAQFQTAAAFDRVAFYIASGIRPHTVNSIYDGSPVTCRVCNGDLFIDAGRSLDYNYFECFVCGDSTSTLTETGASA